MPSFLTAVIVAIVVAVGAAVVLNHYQSTVEHAFASPASVRI
jgi:hypothetical protein